jgi:hypothetical protein
MYGIRSLLAWAHARWSWRIRLALLVHWGLLGLVVGCDSADIIRDLKRFNAAGPIPIKLDMSKLDLANKPTGAYQVAVGDVLALNMPRVMATVAAPTWRG